VQQRSEQHSMRGAFGQQGCSTGRAAAAALVTVLRLSVVGVLLPVRSSAADSLVCGRPACGPLVYLWPADAAGPHVYRCPSPALGRWAAAAASRIHTSPRKAAASAAEQPPPPPTPRRGQHGHPSAGSHHHQRVDLGAQSICSDWPQPSICSAATELEPESAINP
jgi:hypothetical protein